MASDDDDIDDDDDNVMYVMFMYVSMAVGWQTAGSRRQAAAFDHGGGVDDVDRANA